MTDREFCDELKSYSDRICNAIFHMDLEWVDVDIQVNEMRYFCGENAPEKLPLFEMVYASRFRRLWDTWGPEVSRQWRWQEEANADWQEETSTGWQ